MIERPLYLEKLKQKMWNGSIKVITGIRRSGKSYLLNTIFYDYLISTGVDENHIIQFSFDSAIDLEKIGEDLIELEKDKKKINYKKFISYISTVADSNEKFFLLLDEVQRLEAFEFVLNGYLAVGTFDIYVTGSNSKFLSSDVITEFRGRGDEIHIMPLSFSEFYNYTKGDISRQLDEYMTYGGMPRVVLVKTPEEKMSYLANQFEGTYIKDVIERNNINNVEELNDLLNVIASGISSLTNPNKLENAFKSKKKVKLSADTIAKYIRFFEESFILKKALRYDVKGKAYISTPYKLYFEDTGLRNARLGFRQVEYTHIMENVIYNELRCRDFIVDVGVVEIREGHNRKQLEVDFVANKGNNRYYIQSAYDISGEEKLKQETRSLDNTQDSYKKIIVVNQNIISKRNDKGYLFISLAEFLTNPNSLDL